MHPATMPRMKDVELAAVCWVRAVEQGAREGVPWTEDNSAWASREARRAVGDVNIASQHPAQVQAFVVQRAQLAAQRLGEKDAAWKLPMPGHAPWAWRWLLGIGALIIAALIVGNVLGGAQRINLLAPPVLGLLLWNLLVYFFLLVAPGRGLSAWWAQALEAARTKFSSRGASTPLVAARARFAAEWAVATRGVQQARVATALHLAAAGLAALVIASMYLFGLAFDYRAGWDSTWLDAEQVQRSLQAVFVPATALSGIQVPSIETMAGLRFAEGSLGESAARWIHLYAITLALWVVLPRLLLAGWAAWRAQRRAVTQSVSLSEPYFKALLRDGPALARPVRVLPYSYSVAQAQRNALPRALSEALGPGAQPQLQASLPMGSEDALPREATDAPPADVAALFAATATPERETHGAFVRALQQALSGKATLHVLVDESGLRERSAGASDAELRITQRRAAWQRMLHDLSAPAPTFIRLA
jgi:hypothetical protein